MIWLLKPRKKCSSCLKFKSVYIEACYWTESRVLEIFPFAFKCSDGIECREDSFIERMYSIWSNQWIEFNHISQKLIYVHLLRILEFQLEIDILPKMTNISIFHLLFIVFCVLSAVVNSNECILFSNFQN